MTFKESVKTCFKKCVNFKDCASRSEYWWFVLFQILVILLICVIYAFLSLSRDILECTASLWGILTIIPSLAVTVRRLHDSGLSGWHILWNIPCWISSIPGLIFSLLMIYLMCRKTKIEGNKYHQDVEYEL